MKTMLSGVWYTLFTIEFIIWISTSFHAGLSGLVSLMAFLITIPLLLAVEGLELAVTALLGEEVDVTSERAAYELNHIRSDKTLKFFPNRQVFVVLSIVLLTMASSFERIYIPGAGWISSFGLPAIFNMAFPTHTVLLLAQVPGKMLALYSPARFFSQTWGICVVVRWTGNLEVTAPARFITRLLAKILGYPIHHAKTAHKTTIIYPVFDYIDSEWHFVAHNSNAPEIEEAITE
jgi:hypothetical protein